VRLSRGGCGEMISCAPDTPESAGAAGRRLSWRGLAVTSGQQDRGRNCSAGRCRALQLPPSHLFGIRRRGAPHPPPRRMGGPSPVSGLSSRIVKRCRTILPSLTLIGPAFSIQPALLKLIGQARLDHNGPPRGGWGGPLPGLDLLDTWGATALFAKFGICWPRARLGG